MHGIYMTAIMIFGAMAGYCLLRIAFYPIMRFLVGEDELYSNPFYKQGMNIFYYAGLYPSPTWDEELRKYWVRAWWKYAILGLISFGISIYALYLLEISKLNGVS